jgi:hypothetical protein
MMARIPLLISDEHSVHNDIRCFPLPVYLLLFLASVPAVTLSQKYACSRRRGTFLLILIILPRPHQTRSTILKAPGIWMNSRDIFVQYSERLFHAVVTNNITVARESLERGAAANWVGVYDRRTPLMLASVLGNVEMINLLHIWGADPHMRSTNQGLDALSFAISNGHLEACSLLLHLGVVWKCSVPSLIISRLHYGLGKFEESGSGDWATNFCMNVFVCFQVILEWKNRRVCEDEPVTQPPVQVCDCQQWWLYDVFVHHPELFMIPLPEHRAVPAYVYAVFCDWLQLFGDEVTDDEDTNESSCIALRLQEWARRAGTKARDLNL